MALNTSIKPGFSEKTILRKEPFGGLLFQTARGLSIEVNPSGFELLSRLNGKETLNSHRKRLRSMSKIDNGSQVEDFVAFLLMKGVLEDEGAPPKVFDRDKEECLNKLHSPEIVHFSITEQCNLDCPHCYQSKGSAHEPGLKDIERLFQKWSAIGVCQVSLGGGEPLLRRDVPRIVRMARRNDFRVSLTTNGTLVTDRCSSDLLRAGLNQLQVSLHGPKGIHDNLAGRKVFDEAIRGIDRSVQRGLFVGINTLITRDLLGRLDSFLTEVDSHGVRHVNFIRPKLGRRNRQWYSTHCLSLETFRELRDVFERCVSEFSHMVFTHDCSLVQLYKDESPGFLISQGIYGCNAWKRIAYVDSDLNVHGCSHAANHYPAGGNLGIQSMEEIWDANFISNELPISCETGGCTIEGLCSPCTAISKSEVEYCG